MVNIGDRQKGRIKAKNVIDCGYSSGEIIKAIKKALSPNFKMSLKGLKNPYGKGNSSAKIKEQLKKICLDQKLIKKDFYDG